MPRSSRNYYPKASAPPAHNTDATQSIASQEESDAEYARRLQAEEEEYMRNSTIPTTRPTKTSRSGNPSRVSRSHSPQPPTYAEDLDDHELALRLDQEMRDQDVALALQTQEALRSKRRYDLPQSSRSDDIATVPQDRPTGCTKRRLCIATFILMIVAGASILVYVFGGNVWGQLGGSSSNLPPFYTYEEEGNLGEFNEWNNKGKGLQLTVQNGCSSDWDVYFTQAMVDWNLSDALELTATNLESQDLECNAKRGKMIVCNNYYGKTGWTGLNEVYFEGSKIAASVAKMNESYLENAPASEKQYVMCHECGHGFGLPHRDERINNPDLGSCLDYTTNFAVNKQPDDVDYQNLRNIYGILSPKDRGLRGSNNDHQGPELQIDQGWNYQHGRLLHKSEHHVVYENDLGGGIRVVTRLLLAQDH
jgi:hypothetical protein